MTSVSREAYLGVVQHGDADETTETELVTIESVDGEPRMIELTDGTRITLIQPADQTVARAAA